MSHFLPRNWENIRESWTSWSAIYLLTYCRSYIVVWSTPIWTMFFLGWGFACSRPMKMQKRIIHIMTCSKYNAHMSPLFDSSRKLTFDDMLKLKTLKFYYKYLHNELPPYFYCFNTRVQGLSAHTRYPNRHLAIITNHCLEDFIRNVKHYLFAHAWLLYIFMEKRNCASQK